MATMRSDKLSNNESALAMLQAFASYESSVRQSLLLALNEGKQAEGGLLKQAIGRKEDMKKLFFNILWDKTTVDLAQMADLQTLSDHFTIVLNHFDKTLTEFCEAENIEQRSFFSDKKIVLYKNVIELRRASAMCQFHLCGFSANETIKNFKEYCFDINARMLFIQDRQKELQDKMNELLVMTVEAEDLVAVLLSHAQDHQLCFTELQAITYEKPYPPSSILLYLSTLLMGLPKHEDLQGKGRQTGEASITHLLNCFCDENGRLFKRLRTYDELLSDWLRRQVELRGAESQLTTVLPNAVFKKCEVLREQMTVLLAFMNQLSQCCDAMPNKSSMASLTPWPTTSRELKDGQLNLVNTLHQFIGEYTSHESTIRAAETSMAAFSAWLKTDLNPQVDRYQTAVVSVHLYLNQFFQSMQTLIDPYHVPMGQKKRGCLFSFFKAHAPKMAVSGVILGGGSVPVSYLLLAMDIPYIAVIASLSTLIGVSVGAVAGTVQQACARRPSLERDALIVPDVPGRPASAREMISSRFVRKYQQYLFPGVNYPVRDDVELNRFDSPLMQSE